MLKASSSEKNSFLVLLVTLTLEWFVIILYGFQYIKHFSLYCCIFYSVGFTYVSKKFNGTLIFRGLLSQAEYF